MYTIMKPVYFPDVFYVSSKDVKVPDTGAEG